MKLMKPILVGMMAGTALLGAGGISAQAEDRSATSDVGIGFRTNLDEIGPINPTDPDDEGTPGGDGTGMEGPLSIDYISRLDFGTMTTSGNDAVYFAKPDTWTNESGTVKIPNYVQVTDNRGTNAGWTLQVTQLRQLTNENNHEVAGAEITLRNLQANSASGSQAPALGSNGTNNDTTLSIGEAINIARAESAIMAGAPVGAGTWAIMFGDESTADSSVELSIPGTSSVETYTHYATSLKWVLSNTPL